MKAAAEAQGSVSMADRDLLSRVANHPGAPLKELTTRKLQEIARSESIDFATALLHDRLLHVPANREFYQRVHASTQPLIHGPALVGIIPGAFYQQHKNTGADGERIVVIAKEIGCEAERLPLISLGALAENARVILDWLEQRRDKRVVLVALSKGSADLKMALGLSEAARAFGNVSACVSLSGIIQGTTLVNWLERQPMRRMGVRVLLRLRGQRYSVVKELAHGPGTTLAPWPVLPHHLRFIHVLGFPLRRHLSHPWAPRAYERIADLGPNDGGGILLADATDYPGIVLPVWGTDHYMQPRFDVTALLRSVLVEAINGSCEPLQANRSATQPNTPPASRSNA
ncbi:MAG TPA: hypothetical protein VMZ27_14805 [Candidatus Saccharimonadales bacterium]|nr:hypothetical protein [Candidatus Saccharimonadales bacterium]